MRKVLITGVAGETGSVVAEMMLKSGDYMIVGMDDLSDGKIDHIQDILDQYLFDFLETDITEMVNGNFISEINQGISGVFNIREYDPDIVINMAAKVKTKYFYENPDLTFKVNCQGAIDLFDEVVELSRRRIDEGREKVIFINASTSEVYGHGTSDIMWSESTPSLYDAVEESPRWSYAHGKILTEYYMNHYSDVVDVCHIRYANCYGPRDLEPQHVIPTLIHASYSGEEISITENPSDVYRTFLYMDDAARATISLIDNMKSGTAYNVGTTEEISIADLVELIEDITGNEIKANPDMHRAGDPKRRMLDTSRIRETTGWEPKVNLRAGVRKVAEAIKEVIRYD